MARTFSIDTAASPSWMLERARRTASQNGVTLVGDESSGRFSHKMLRGEYRRLGRTVTVTITYKHRLVPWSVLEGRLRGLFGSDPLGCRELARSRQRGRRVAAGVVEEPVAGLHTITGIRIVAGIRTSDESSLTRAITNEEGLQAFALRWHRCCSWYVCPNVQIRALDNIPLPYSPYLVEGKSSEVCLSSVLSTVRAARYSAVAFSAPSSSTILRPSIISKVKRAMPLSLPLHSK